MKDNLGQTILHVSVDAMNPSAVTSIINLGIAKELINTADNDGMTALHIAAINFDIEIFNFLAQLNGDYNIKDSHGKTCLEYLQENDDIDKNILDEINNLKI
jgi:ankyrin repeat protein